MHIRSWKETRLPFLDEDVVSFLSSESLESIMLLHGSKDKDRHHHRLRSFSPTQLQPNDYYVKSISFPFVSSLFTLMKVITNADVARAIEELS
jgi:hypothetical protein